MRSKKSGWQKHYVVESTANRDGRISKWLMSTGNWSMIGVSASVTVAGGGVKGALMLDKDRLY